MNPNEPSLFTYLPYVTIQQAWGELKATFFAWLIMSGVVVAFGMLAEKGVTATESFWAEIPQWAWYAAAVSAIAWMGRGETYKVRLPILTFKAWFLFAALFFLFMFLMSILPSWGAIPFYFAFVFLVTAGESLSSLGKENYEKLHKETQGGSEA